MFTKKNKFKYVVLVLIFFVFIFGIILSERYRQQKNILDTENKNFTISEPETLSLGSIVDAIDVVYIKDGNIVGQADNGTTYQLSTSGNINKVQYSKQSRAIAATERTLDGYKLYFIDLKNQTQRVIFDKQTNLTSDTSPRLVTFSFSSEGTYLILTTRKEINLYSLKQNKVYTVLNLSIEKKNDSVPFYGNDIETFLTDSYLSPNTMYLFYATGSEKGGTHYSLYHLKDGLIDTFLDVDISTYVRPLGFLDNNTFLYTQLVTGSPNTFTPQKSEIVSYSLNTKEKSTISSIDGYIQFGSIDQETWYFLIHSNGENPGNVGKQSLVMIDSKKGTTQKMITLENVGDREVFRLWGKPFVTPQYIYSSYIDLEKPSVEVWRISKDKESSLQDIIKISNASL